MDPRAPYLLQKYFNGNKNIESFHKNLVFCIYGELCCFSFLLTTCVPTFDRNNTKINEKLNNTIKQKTNRMQRNNNRTKKQNHRLSNIKAFLFSSQGVPSTPQHTDSHPCTRPCPAQDVSKPSFLDVCCHANTTQQDSCAARFTVVQSFPIRVALVFPDSQATAREDEQTVHKM